MKNKKLITIGLVGILIIGILIGSYFMFFYSPYKFTEDRPIKILRLNSYHSVNLWTNLYLEGFEEVFEREGVEIELRRFEMDTIRHPSEEWAQEISREAKEFIDEWQPDLIYATDDNAQKYVIEPYYLNTNIPIVIAAVDEDPSFYNYVGSKNVAGVLGKEHVVDAIDLLKELFPHVKKIVVISEPSDQWAAALDSIKSQQDEFSDIELVGFEIIPTFEKFQERVTYYQDKVDAFLFTPLNRFVDKNGNIVDSKVLAKWLVENSKLPEITLWTITVEEGMLAAVTPSYYERGKTAGEISYGILVDGKSPSSFGFKPTKIGAQYINLARAETLGLEKEDIQSIILINSEIIEGFPWEEEGKNEKFI